MKLQNRIYFTILNRSDYDFSGAHRLVVDFRFPYAVQVGGFSPGRTCDGCAGTRLRTVLAHNTAARVGPVMVAQNHGCAPV